ncbi:MAG: ribonuclease H [Planctomycetota bacterium]|nr:ribonuclease HI [Planctomycetota bacterium]MCX8040659.1 ribonuclease HI [Planctomycetota bacterium]MDW8372802.1 ribonuclease H [Planctomycetota bacterium]
MSAPAAVIAWTDGGCRGNPGPGGWAFVLVETATRRCLERCDGEAETTNNRMELLAAVMALRSLRRSGLEVEIRSDSRYLVQAARDWLPGWKERGWRRRDGELQHVDLWQELDRLLGAQRVRWRWLPGHAGDPGNERADALVNQAMDALAAGRDPAWSGRRLWEAGW